MRYIVVITIVLVVQSLNTFGQECKKLSDGEYFFKYKTKGYEKSDFVLTIKGDSFSITKEGKVFPEEKIDWWSDNCMFRLYSLENQMADRTISSNKTQKKDSINVIQDTDIIRNTFLSYGGHCYELMNNRKFKLTYCGNLHITLAEGRIVKK